MNSKPILNREFTTREKGLILALAVVLIVIVYYVLVVQNVASAQAANQDRLSELNTEIELQESLATKRETMQAELDELGSVDKLPTIEVYDNFRPEFNELSDILAKASSFDVSFEVPKQSGTLVRRVANIAFTAPTYDKVLSITSAIESCKYRCLITEMDAETRSTNDGEIIRADLKVTFYETTEGASDLSGLVQAEDKD